MGVPTNHGDGKRQAFLAAACVAVADLLASNFAHWEWRLWVLMAGHATLVGAVAAVITAVVRRPWLAAPLVLAATQFLLLASVLSKGVAIPPGARSFAWAGSMISVLLVLSWMIPGTDGGAEGRRTRIGRILWVSAALFGASLWCETGRRSAPGFAILAALPPLAALLWRIAGRRVSAGVCTWIAVVAFLLPGGVAGWLEREPSLDRSSRPETAGKSTPSSDPISAGASEQPENLPNLLLLVIDTLRADALEGEKRAAPALRALAGEGASFAQAIAAAPWTLPSVCSLLSSKYPHEHGAVHPGARMHGQVTTLAESLYAAGYETAAFTGGGFVDPAFGVAQGFERFDARAEWMFAPFRFHVPLVWRIVKNRYFAQRWLLSWVNEFSGVRGLRRKLDAFLERRDRRRPLFLFVHTYQVHDYYLYYAGDPVPDGDAVLDRRFRGRLTVQPRELETARQKDLDWFRGIYQHRLERVDQELDLLLKKVRAHSDRDWCVVVTSDHGEGFDAVRKRVHHGGRLHDDLLRVPLIVVAPGVRPGSTVAVQVSTLDVMPTILNLAGAPVPEGLAGRSLTPWLLSDSSGAYGSTSPQATSHVAGSMPDVKKGPSIDVVFSEELNPDRALVSLRTPSWKLISGHSGEEIYRVDLDPEERMPVLGELPPDLRERWRDFQRRISTDSMATLVSIPDAATRAHLEALGYVDR